MNPTEFLRGVQPSTGLHVLAIFRTKESKPRHEYYSTVEELATAVKRERDRNYNVYYGISSFQTNASRTKENVLYTRVLVLDVDCGEGKPYLNKGLGAKATDEFLTVTGMPNPLWVDSGNGFHLYWILDEDLPPERWQPLADALKLLTEQHNFTVDPHPTANGAGILRPLDTTNPKGGGTVRLLNLTSRPYTGPYRVADIAALLPTQAAAHVPHMNGKHTGLSKLAANITGGIEQSYATPVADVVATKCQQIKFGIANPNKVEEPVWYAMMGVAGYCTEPDATAIAWSKGHDKFSATEAVAKMNQWKAQTDGPATCKRFEDENPSGCKGCPFKGKITSPAQLGERHKEITVLPEGLPVEAAKDVELPKPFHLTTSGIVEIRDGVQLAVCPFNVVVVSYGMDPVQGYEVAHFQWERKPGSWNALAFRQSLLNPSEFRDFAKTMGDHGILLRHSAHQLPRLQDMLRSYIVELHKQRAQTNYHATMGWKEDNQQFVVGSKLLRRNDDTTVDEGVTPLTAHASNLGYGVKGTLQNAVHLTRLLDKHDMQVQMFTLCVSLSAPLYELTGFKAQTISLYGTTGSGKTLAQLWAQSLWGNPDALHLGAKYTDNALYHHLGTICHLPVTLDEFTMQDGKRAGTLLYEATQGRDKMRLNRRAEATATMPFAMPIIISTNMSLSSKLQDDSSHADAQLIRLLEVKVTPNVNLVNDPPLASTIKNLLNENYGYIGCEFIKGLLALGPQAVKDAIKKAHKEFKAIYGVHFDGIERFWANILVLAHLAGKWATEWGLIKFNYQRGIQWVLDQLASIRHTVATSKRDGWDVLAEYLNKFGETAIYEDITAGRSVVRPANLNARGPLHVRYIRSRGSPTSPFDRGIVEVDKKGLKDHMKNEGYDIPIMMEKLQPAIVRGLDKEVKTYLGRGTGNNPPQLRVIVFNLTHEQLRGTLNTTVADDDAAMPERILHIV